MNVRRDAKLRFPVLGAEGTSGRLSEPRGDYAGHLFCVRRGLGGSHQIRGWKIKLGDLKEIPRRAVRLSLGGQTSV